MDTHFVYTTWPDADTAQAVGQACVEQGLCACVNIFPPHLCLYRWEGGVESGQEVVMILKTTAADVASLRTHVIEAHPYDVPVFAVLDVNGPASHAPFINWLQGA